MQHNNRDWWRGALIYQIYPRSFMDSNQDGIGDLPGITRKLDYITSLNVDAIWLSPFFTSPMKDFGYDISNYRDVDPIFGTLADFDQLIAGAHERGLKVIIDQVLSHTSDQHPWFEESRRSRDNAKADWYVWADPKADGSPPNNWLSVFGGSAWAWDSRRRQYYLHNFLDSQPDLNFHNPAVVAQLLSDLEFWLQRGVDGFRLDAINFCFHDRALRDNPAKEQQANGGIGVRLDNPYAYQQHRYDKSQPANLAFLQQLRALLERYPGTTTLGEIGCDQSLQTMAAYTADGDKLHMAYSFDLLTEQCAPEFIRHTMETVNRTMTDGWPCWSIGNHDVERVASRWGRGPRDGQQLKMMLALLLSLKGSYCIYQGEELGLTEAELSLEDLQDPYGIAFWPEYKGRDGCRTPLPWERAQLNAGFSSVKPWLPVPAEHYPLAVSDQQGDPDSLLNAYRRFAAWRRQYPALLRGEIDFLEAPAGTLLVRRHTPEQTLLVAINMGVEPVALPLPLAQGAEAEQLSQPLFDAELDGQQLRLGRYGVAFLRLHQAPTHPATGGAQ